MTPLGHNSIQGSEANPATASVDYRAYAEVYHSGKYGTWFWRLNDRKGHIVCESVEPFPTKEDAVHAVMTLGEYADRIQEVRYS